MPSQEEYLDNLLKDIGKSGTTKGADYDEAKIPLGEESLTAEQEENSLEDVFRMEADTNALLGGNVTSDTSEEIVLPDFDGSNAENNGIDISDTMSMTVEDIERLIASSSEDAKTTEQEFQDVPEDLLMLQDSQEEDLQDIHDMLQKSDNNVAIDQEASDLFDMDREDPVQQLMNEIEEASDEVNKKTKRAEEKKQKAEEKKRKREEKKQKREEAKQKREGEKRTKKENRRKPVSAKSVEDALDQETESLFADMEALGNMEDVADFEAIGNINGVTDMDTVDGLDALTSVDSVDNIGLFDDVQDTGAENTDALMDIDIDADLLGELAEIIPEEDLPRESVVSEKKKKKGLFAKIVDALTETVEENEENSQLLLSDENEEILREINKDKGKKKRGKKKKKGAEAEGEAGDDISDIRDINDDKGGKKEKKKKAKKQKEKKMPKLSRADEKPQKKLNSKRVKLIFIVCVTVAVVLVILSNVSIDFADKRNAAKAYNEGDYETCYQNLVGKNLTESQKIMFGKSESILRARLWIREYEILADEGAELQALDSLIQSVNDYPKLYDFSSNWNASSEVKQIYDQIIRILWEKYSVSETLAKEIAAEPSDIEYTRKVMAALDKENLSYDETLEEVEPIIPLPDQLPEEEELEDIDFYDNN